ncbi:MAG: hypothetical protein K8E66_00860 [Phycisphaerales bacterium]|nr:hypothetical protein [Phycisphaerales bacterium]
MNRPAMIVTLLCCLAGFPASPQAATIERGDFSPDAVTLDFDDLNGSHTWCDGDQITDQYENVTFEIPGSSCVICARSEIDGNFVGNSDPNLAFVQQGLCDPPADFAQVTFDVPVRRVGTSFWTTSDANLVMTAYDASDLLIEEVAFVGTGGIGGWSGFAGLDAGSAVIARLELRSRPLDPPDRPFNFSLDDFLYEGAAAVPVQPGTWGMVKARYR